MKKIFLLLFSSLSASNLETKPWLGNPWEFKFESAFTYSRYGGVQGASLQLPHASNDRLLAFDLGMTGSDLFDGQLEIEFADTPRQRFGLRSGALQLRVLWLDDIAGDPISWTTGLNVRGVSGHSSRDVSSPYHAPLNVEMNTSVGKEWSQQGFWGMRTWGLIGIGMGNRGMPWTRILGVLEKNWNNHHRVGFSANGYFGFGREHHVNTDHFYGWGKFHHQSIDVGVVYRYHFDLWGEISLSYDRRVFARCFPQNVNFFTLSYQIPFSFF